MINYRQIETDIVNGLQNYLADNNIICPVILANQTTPMPKYPYISFTVINPVKSNAKGYCIAEDQTRYKSLLQTWSFTVQSDDDLQALDVALMAYDFFADAGNIYLSDKGIVAQSVSDVTTRDNILSIEYEYRKGFDVDFLLTHTIDSGKYADAGEIDTADIRMEV